MVYYIEPIYNHQNHFKILRLKMDYNCVKKKGEHVNKDKEQHGDVYSWSHSND